MNMVKGIIELTWDVFFKDLAQAMNFRSEKALQCCKKVSDHHKGWQLLTIAREALAKEVALPFVREELKKEAPDLSPVPFAKFLKDDVHDKSYAFIADCCFEYIEAVFMYREGIRKNQPDLTYCGLAKFAKL